MKNYPLNWKFTIKSKVLIALAASGMFGIQAIATDDTWVGNTSVNWNTAANWSPAAVPVAGDDLFFGAAGSAGADLTNDIAAGTSFTGITFEGGASAYILFGNSIGITGGITNSSGAAEIVSNNIALGGNVTVDTGAGGTTTLASLMSGSFGLTNTGSGALILATNTTFGANGSSFTGGVTVNSGTLAISTPEHDGKTCLGSGPLTVNAGATVTNSGDGFGFAGSGNAFPTNIFINGGTINCGTGGKGSSAGTGAGTLPNITFLNGGTITIFGSAIGTLNGAGVTMGITNLASSTTAIMGVDPGSTAAGNWNNTKPTTFSVAAGTVTGGPYPGVDMYFSARLNHSDTMFKVGAGTLELAGANPMNSGGGNSFFTISNGSVVVSGSLPATCFVTNAAVLCGSNLVAGSVINAGSTAQINQETNYLITGTVGTLTVGNLNMSAGGTCSLDLSTSAGSGNDEVVVTNALTLNGNTFHINALGGTANLASSPPYVLVSAAAVSGSPNSVPAWDGTAPANSSDYEVTVLGNNVVLESTIIPFILSSTATPSTATDGQSVSLSVTVTNGAPPYTVDVNASSVGASSGVALALEGGGITPGVGYVYTNTIAVATSVPGSYLLPVNITDSASQAASNNIPLTVAVYLTWNGDASGNSSWDTAGEIEWQGGNAYQQGDNTRFDDTATGLDATNVNLLTTVAPGGIVVSNTAGHATGIYAFNGASASDCISGPGSIVKQGSGTLYMLEGSDTFSGGINVQGGSLILSNLQGTVAISGGLTVTNNSGVVLDQYGTLSGGVNIANGSSVQLGANDNFGLPPSGNWILNGSLTFDWADNVTVTNTIGGASSGNLNKNDTSTVTLTAANTFTGNISVNGGTLSNTVPAANNGSTGGFGASTVPGRVITVSPGATISSGKNNWFGNEGVPDTNLPSMMINGGTAFSARYTSIGNITLDNGATLMTTHSNGVDGGTYFDFQFRGTVTVGGAAASVITNGDNWGDHLSTNTVFNVAVTSGSGPDLIVLCPLVNQSGDYTSAPGGFTKTGPGTMMFASAVPTIGTNGYTGNTTVNAGTLALGGSTIISGSTNITIAGGATLDVSALSSFSLGPPQVLSNNTSTAILNCGSGGANTGTGTLSLTYGSGTPSMLVTNGTLTLTAGTKVKINNTGAALAAGTYSIVSVATAGNAGLVSGTAPSSVTVGGNGLVAGGVASLQISGGVLNLVVTVIPPKPAIITGVHVSGSTLTITAGNGADDGQFVLLESTNIALPLPQWTPVLTNSFDASGNLNLSTNIVNPNRPEEFYILQMP